MPPATTLRTLELPELPDLSSLAPASLPMLPMIPLDMLVTTALGSLPLWFLIGETGDIMILVTLVTHFLTPVAREIIRYLGKIREKMTKESGEFQFTAPQKECCSHISSNSGLISVTDDQYSLISGGVWALITSFSVSQLRSELSSLAFLFMPQSNSLAITKTAVDKGIQELDAALAAVFLGIQKVGKNKEYPCERRRVVAFESPTHLCCDIDTDVRMLLRFLL